MMSNGEFITFPLVSGETGADAKVRPNLIYGDGAVGLV